MMINEELYCHTTCIIEGTKERSLTKGKIYKIVRIQNYEFTVLDDHNKRHSFSYLNYKKWFHTKNDYRKNKLKQIEKR